MSEQERVTIEGTVSLPASGWQAASQRWKRSQDEVFGQSLQVTTSNMDMKRGFMAANEFLASGKGQQGLGETDLMCKHRVSN